MTLIRRGRLLPRSTRRIVDMFSDLTDNSRNRGRLDAYFGRSSAQTAKQQPAAARCSPPLSANPPQTVQSAAVELRDDAAISAEPPAVEAVQLHPSLDRAAAIDLTAPEQGGAPNSSSAIPQLRQRGPGAAGSASDEAPARCRSPAAEDGGGIGSEALSEGSPCCSPRSQEDAPSPAQVAAARQYQAVGAPEQPRLSPEVGPAHGCPSQSGMCQLAAAAHTTPEATSPGSALETAAPAAPGVSTGEPQLASPTIQPPGSGRGRSSTRSSSRSRKSDIVSRRVPASPPAAEPSAGGTAGGGASDSSREMDEDIAALALDGICPREQQVTAEKLSPWAP